MEDGISPTKLFESKSLQIDPKLIGEYVRVYEGREKVEKLTHVSVASQS